MLPFIFFVLNFIVSVEMATLKHIDNKTEIHILTNKEVESLISDYEKAEAAAEAAKKEQKQKP